MHFFAPNRAHAQSSLVSNPTPSAWERINIGLTFNQVISYNFQYGSGFLKNHPERAIEATASVRLWNHLEVGGYMSLMGASPYGNSSVREYNGTQLYRLRWENGYAVSGGGFVQLHLISFAKRNTMEGVIDLTARAGFGMNGETDGAWVGFGAEYRVTRQIRIVTMVDWGQFPLADLMAITDNETSSWRSLIGIKFSLK